MEVTWGRAARVWWSYLWRNLFAIVAAMVIGGLIGAVLGFILGIAGVAQNKIVMLTLPIGMIVGLGISIVPIKMILGKNFGEFRLVLVKNQTPQ